MENFKIAIFLISTILLSGCKEKTKSFSENSNNVELSEEQLYRPNYHFTPKVGWMNDPNGMFYLNNTYHLFFQHYPDDNRWGPMHWGHATSKDMISWEEQSIALYPDNLGYIFSGSAVVDQNNTSGFGQNGSIPIVAIFTYHDPKKADNGDIDAQTQGIAYSLDNGMNWTKYSENPVLENPGIRDFRDPKVIWDNDRNQWLMTIAAGQETQFYSSKNLRDWSFLSSFGKGIGNHDGVWECPDLFPIRVQGTDTIKWVLLVSINPGAPNGGSGTQYFVGDFDGKNYIVDPEFEQSMNEKHTFWSDFGKDNYAGVTWSNIPENDGRRLFIGWMSNWQYANEVPTETWRSATTVAREINLVKNAGDYRLIVNPVDELTNYLEPKYSNENIKIVGSTELLNTMDIDLTKAVIDFKVSKLEPTRYTFKLSSDQGDELTFGYDHKNLQFFLNRSNSGVIEFSENFANKVSIAPRINHANSLNGKIVLDKTSVELFFDDGQIVLTEIVFPTAPFQNLSLETEDYQVTIDEIKAFEIKIN